MHPIAKALKALDWTQQELVDRVNRLRPRSSRGHRINLSQGHLSSAISEKAKHPRVLSVEMAKAIAEVLEISAADILLYERPIRSRRSKSAA